MRTWLMVMACMGVTAHGVASDSDTPATTLRAVPEQGGFWIGQVAPGSTVELAGKKTGGRR
jgi:hypothetical protein